MPSYTTRNFREQTVFVLFRNFILPILAIVLLIVWLTDWHSSAKDNNEARTVRTEQLTAMQNTTETLSSPVNCGDGWDNRFADAANGDVLAVAVDASGNLFIGGDFTQVGGVAVNHIAKWNGLNWSALGGGTDDYVNAIAVSGNDIYAGGEFNSAGGASAKHIAKWNGSAWSALGSGTDANVASIAVSGGDVYAGGFFETAGGAPAKHIAKWNGSNWSALGGGTSDIVNAVVVSSGNVYAGGFFETAGGASAKHIAKWNGSNWSALGGGADGDVYALAVSGNNLYVGGSFYTAGGVSGTNRIAKWDGSNWSALGGGADNTIYAIAASGNNIYTSGYFTSAGQVAANRVSRWNGSNWSALGGGTNDAAVALAASGSDVYAGGFFSTAGCRASNKIARYFLQSFSGGANGDWHNAANWSSGTIPGTDSDVNIGVADTFISTSDATIRDLRVDAGRTLTIAANRTLVVNGNLNLLGNITGAGTLIVNNCSPAAISGGGEGAGYISLSLRRCVNNSGTFNFPVGTANGYSPVQISNVLGGGNFTVKANQGAYPGAANGLSTNRLQRFWNLTNGGITSADVQFNYLASDVTLGTESNYKIFRINGNTAENVSGVVNAANHTATVTGVSNFSPWTLGEQANFSGALRGVVTYGIAPAGQTRFVPGVTLTAAGTPQATAQSDAAGAYHLANLGAGAYTVTPSKTGGIGTPFSSVDASRVLQTIVGLVTLTPQQMAAADSDSTGDLSTVDASNILKAIVGLPGVGAVGQWRFLPAQKNYSSLTGELTNQNYEAVIVGDIDGDWAAARSVAEEKADLFEKDTPSLMPKPQNSSPSPESFSPAGVVGIPVSLPTNATAASNSTVTIPITVGNTTGQNITGFNFVLDFQASVITPLNGSLAISRAGTLSQDFTCSVNTNVSGQLSVACAGDAALAGSGTLINLRFNVVGNSGATTALTLSTFRFNAGTPMAAITNGQFTAQSPTAAQASVGGRVTNAAGRGVFGAQVVMVKSNGELRHTRTNPFGFYKFSEVAAGETCTINVTHKNYTFASRIITVTEDLVGFDFTATPR